MKLEIPTNVQKLMETLETNGYECYVVGGAIRSILLGLDVHDYDLTTNALPEEMEKVFKAFKVIETGIRHGTITVISDHTPVEITTYRKDTTYHDHRHPDEVIFTRTIREDCARRDFTINALCYNEKEGLLDFFDGQTDLRKHLIRCIRDPYQRFEEDALRILRAIRFASQLRFNIEENTSRAIIDLSLSLKYVSSERIKEEFTRFLNGNGCSYLFYPYRKVFSVFLPELEEMNDEWDILITRLKQSKNDPSIRMAVLLSSSCFKDPKKTLRSLKYSNDEIRMILQMILHRDRQIQTKTDVLHLLNTLHCEFSEYIEYRKAMDQNEYTDTLSIYNDIQADGTCYSLKQLAVNGNDLLRSGYHGKEISETLNRILNAVMDEQLPNDRDAIFAYLNDQK